MSLEVSIQRAVGEGVSADMDRVPIEEPLEIRLVHYPQPHEPSESPLSVTMRTPGHDVELGLGFLFAERIIESLEDVVQTHTTDNGVTFVLGPEVRFDFRRLMRHFFTSSSCGVCGRAAIEPLLGRPRTPDGIRLPYHVVTAFPAQLRAAQPLFAATAGVHAAALFDAEGELHLVREDVGRHNAVDKVVGHQLQQGRTHLRDRILMVSGRTSYDILQKAAVAGIPVVAAVGAPSSLAVQMATELDMTLLGFVGPGRFNIYAGAGRILS